MYKRQVGERNPSSSERPAGESADSGAVDDGACDATAGLELLQKARDAGGAVLDEDTDILKCRPARIRRPLQVQPALCAQLPAASASGCCAAPNTLQLSGGSARERLGEVLMIVKLGK